MADDCNTKLSPLDKQGRLTWKETKYRNSLLHFIKEINLGVIYGEIHPKNKSYTFESKPLKLKSSIVFFVLISRKYKPDITKMETRLSVAPDDKAVPLRSVHTRRHVAATRRGDRSLRVYRSGD